MACLAVFGVSGGSVPSAQVPGQVTGSVGVVPFLDESGAGVPNVGSGVALLLRQRLSSEHRDVLAKALPAAGAQPATVEQLTTLGAQHAVRFVIQGGILPIEVGVTGDPPALVVSLYADVVAPDSGRTQTVRVDGTAPAPDGTLGIADPATADVTSAAFAKTPVGRALAEAVGRLAEAVYQAAMSAPSASGAAAPQAAAEQAPTAQDAATSPENADADLQQLIADAQNAISSYGGAAPELAEQVRAGLEQLNAALTERADQLARGEDTQASDQAVAQARESLRGAVNALVQAQVDGQASLPPGESGAPSDGVMSRVNTFASDLLSLVQKVQELEALVGGAGDEAATAESGQNAATDPSSGTEAVEGAPGSVTGVVVEDGQPVGGAEVTETSTGVTTTTGPDGSFTLAPLPPGLLGVLSVKQRGTLLATGRIPVLAARVSLADFQIRKGGLAGTRLGVLSSTAMSRVVPARAGALKGRVLDPRGNPVALALVTVPGVGPIRTNARGEFFVPRITAGAVTISVRHPALGSAALPVTVAVGKTPAVVTVRLTAPPPGRMAAAAPPRLVALDKTGGLVHGHVRDQNNRDLPGVRVSLLRGGATLSVLTGSAGRFALSNVSPGGYRVVIARPGFETATREITLRARGDAKIDLKLKQITALVDTMRRTAAAKRVVPPTAGRTTVVAKPVPLPAPQKPTAQGGIVRPVLPSPAKPGTHTPPRLAPGHVRGRVTDARTGKPLGGVTVLVSGGGNAVTGGDGSYRIDGVTPGAHEVRVSRSGYQGQSRSVSVGAGSTVGADFALRALLLRKR